MSLGRCNAGGLCAIHMDDSTAAKCVDECEVAGCSAEYEFEVDGDALCREHAGAKLGAEAGMVTREQFRAAAGLVAALLADPTSEQVRWEARGFLRRYVDGASRAEVEALDTITGG